MKKMMVCGTGHGSSRDNSCGINQVIGTKTVLINPNAVREGDHIEAHFPNGEIERGVVVREGRQRYRNKRRMMLCEDGAKRGHIITGCAGFPDGTQFYRVTVGTGEMVWCG